MEAFSETSARTEHIWQSHSHPSMIRFLRYRQTKIPMKSPRTAVTANTIPKIASIDKLAAPGPGLDPVKFVVAGSVPLTLAVLLPAVKAVNAEVVVARYPARPEKSTALRNEVQAGCP
jgi:hypothetical protein